MISSGHPTPTGSEELVGAWTWDGDRLVELELPERFTREVWTWDDAGHLVAIDGEYDGVRRGRTFAWDGDALIEATEITTDGRLVTTTWTGRCPEEMWSGIVPADFLWDRVETPFPSVERYLPYPDEPW